MNVRLLDGAELPRYAHDGDAGLDLRITHDVTLEPGARATVGTGLAVEIPQGCWCSREAALQASTASRFQTAWA